MTIFCVRICDNLYLYDTFLLRNEETKEDYQKTRRKLKKRVDCVLLYYVIQEFRISETYRSSFFNFYYTVLKEKGINVLEFILQPTEWNLIDYKWNDEVDYMVRERCELDHTLSWLSTLGGAFSALGDYFVNCAEMAGKISLHQFQLALRLGDPNVESRCKLYMSLSLIQRKRFKLARKIVYGEYVRTKNAVIVDFRLINMCKGIWAKLQYEFEVYRKNKRKRE